MKNYLGNAFMQLHAEINSATTVLCPEKIYLDITEDCNLHCAMCRDKVKMDGKSMPMELFKKLVDETSPYCKSYSLFIWGEPLVLNDFQERVQYVHAKKKPECNIEISTNGMLLTGEMIRFLHRYEVRVIVSFDGASKAIFEKIRTGANFERVCSNAEVLNHIYSDKSLDIAPAVYTSVQRDNQRELTEIVNVVDKLGFRRIGFGLVTGPVEFTSSFNIELCNDLSNAYRSAEQHDLFIELYPTRVGDFVYWGDEYVPAEGFAVKTRCDAPFINTVVRYDGEVCLCCNFGATVGNITNRNLLEIWRSLQYDNLRNTVNDIESMPDPCRRCWWVNRF